MQIMMKAKLSRQVRRRLTWFLQSLSSVFLAIAITGCSTYSARPIASEPINYFYIDKTGKKALDGVGYYGDSFHEGLALVCDEYRDDYDVQSFRYIDHSGKTKFSISAYSAYPFSEGLAAVSTKVEKGKGACHGYVDKSGKWVIAPTFLGGDSFSDGLALVLAEGQRFQYIDHTGEPQIDVTGKLAASIPNVWWQNLNAFSEGCALVVAGLQVSPKQATYGYIDKKGDWKISLGDDVRTQFFEGLAHKASKDSIGKSKATFVNTADETALTLPHIANRFSEGLCSFSSETEKYKSETTFAYGTSVIDEGFKHGYLDRKGHIVVKPVSEDYRDFSEGLAAFTLNGKVGYINSKGAVVVSPQYAYGGDFSEGLAVVVPFAKDGTKPLLKLWGAPTGKYFAQERIYWAPPESNSD